MRHPRWIGLCALVAGCATGTPPKELADARQTYHRIASGATASLVPAEVHKAREALEVAERAYIESPDGEKVRDLAYVAERKARVAEARGGMEQARQQKQLAERQLQETHEKIARTSQDQLVRTQRKLVEERRETDRTQAALDQTRSQLEKTEEARREAERKAEQALKDLAALNAVREDERGTIITIPGSVLFTSGQWTLLPSAQMRLDQVGEALATRSETIVVEGHTDDRGSAGYNQELSQKRAQAVRDYLVMKGVPGERCKAIGFGKTRPIADNRSPEGRANNRRVEIVIQNQRVSQR